MIIEDEVNQPLPHPSFQTSKRGPGASVPYRGASIVHRSAYCELPGNTPSGRDRATPSFRSVRAF